MILIILTYLAGVLTILSPCILPVLPFVFSKSQGSFLKNGLPLLAGMALTFSLFSALALLGGQWISKANELGRDLALVLLSIFGLSLIFPRVTEKLVEPITRLGSAIGRDPKKDSIGGSILVGVSTGLLWAPCAGPILGLVLTGAAAQGNAGISVGLLLSYSLGAITSLALALLAGNKVFGTLKKFLGVDQVIKKVLGVAVLLGVAMIALNLDRTLLTRISKVETASIEENLLKLVKKNTGASTAENDLAKDSLSDATAEANSQTGSGNGSGGSMGHGKSDGGPMPELTGAVAWLNSPPLSTAELRGKVVLVDFWTYSCINCLRTLPYLKAWWQKYQSDGLVIIGVHTPEFPFEKNQKNVEAALKDLGIQYPVAIDNDYKIWNVFKNQYWPAHYFIDRRGQIRHHHFGEGDYEESEKIIRELLSEDGGHLNSDPANPPSLVGAKEGAATGLSASAVEAPKSQGDSQSPETYLGYGRAAHFVSTPDSDPDVDETYRIGVALKADQWGLIGRWKINEDKVVAKKPGGRIVYRFRGRDLHLVLGLGEGKKPVHFKVSIDGHAPESDHGADIDANGSGEVRAHRLYQLIRRQNLDAEEHTFEIEFKDADVEAYAFTFG